MYTALYKKSEFGSLKYLTIPKIMILGIVKYVYPNPSVFNYPYLFPAAQNPSAVFHLPRLLFWLCFCLVSAGLYYRNNQVHMQSV